MMVMTAMLLLGLATVSLVDGETNSSRKSRQSESRLNLTEGALATELFQLSHNWPTASSRRTRTAPTSRRRRRASPPRS